MSKTPMVIKQIIGLFVIMLGSSFIFFVYTVVNKDNDIKNSKETQKFVIQENHADSPAIVETRNINAEAVKLKLPPLLKKLAKKPTRYDVSVKFKADDLNFGHWQLDLNVDQQVATVEQTTGKKPSDEDKLKMLDQAIEQIETKINANSN